MIQEERVRPLNDADARRGAYVLYWMQGAMRVGFNHAFAYAADRADEAGAPLVVVFGLTADYP
ncbi:MAG TPA: deoxyribodipyrimidine photolyase, partial [Acidobacteriota bacterium]|nr:deoxyribodipyrimidine photolyase [Acidobacteriota bacterium]